MFSVIFRVGVARVAAHASPPRIGELGTKKFVFVNLHKNDERGKAKKNEKSSSWWLGRIWKFEIRTALKFWLLKNIPMHSYLAHYSSETAGFLTTKKLRLFLHTVCCTREPTKKVIGQLFLAEFSTKLASRNWGIREVDLDSTQYNGLKSIPKFAYTGTKPATDQFCCNLLCLRYKMNSVTPFLTSAGVFCEFTNLDPCDSALWDFAGFSSPFQSTKLST